MANWGSVCRGCSSHESMFDMNSGIYSDRLCCTQEERSLFASQKVEINNMAQKFAEKEFDGLQKMKNKLVMQKGGKKKVHPACTYMNVSIYSSF